MDSIESAFSTLTAMSVMSILLVTKKKKSTTRQGKLIFYSIQAALGQQIVELSNTLEGVEE